MRLVGGSNATEGRVEICLNNEWGTVCDEMWNNTDASIVCRQLELASNGKMIQNVEVRWITYYLQVQRH